MDVLSAAARLARLLGGCALACALGAFAQAPDSAIKAAFLYKFAGYVEWPAAPAPDAPFVFATLAADDVAAELERILPGRTVEGRKAVVRRVKEGEALKGVHILFVGRAEPNPRAALRAAQQQGVLTVSDTERGLESGAAINFVTADDRVGFEVSLDSAERGGHRISSRMLAVARRVVPKS